MKCNTHRSKPAYLAPVVELIQIGKSRSILESNSFMLIPDKADLDWEVEELEDYGEL